MHSAITSSPQALDKSISSWLAVPRACMLFAGVQAMPTFPADISSRMQPGIEKVRLDIALSFPCAAHSRANDPHDSLRAILCWPVAVVCCRACMNLASSSTLRPTLLLDINQILLQYGRRPQCVLHSSQFSSLLSTLRPTLLLDINHILSQCEWRPQCV